jgi:serine/threonine protein kinase
MRHIDASRWALMTPVLDELLYADEAGCTARLARIRSDDPELASDIAYFLAQRTAIARDDFLGGRALDLVADATGGESVGHYLLERELGQGGMGTVWLARRNDGRYEEQVAIKFLDAPRFERSGIERFRREGSVLARLAHPNIACLIDAGVTDRKQPYLVLEYVDGEQIDHWCSARGLGTRERIRLFREVLAAVAHAHSRLILHRDLKPSNIFVTRDGRVKLLDFGIAKLLDESSPHATALTLAGRALTPDYASPEQILRQPLSVASDVYSLGVVLYELVCGRRPYKLKHDSLGSLEDAIVTAEPAPPSAAAGVPSQRRELAGDIDTIVLKALKKEPAERYATINDLLDDLDRHLEGLPVRARPESLSYRARKFARRNAVLVAAGGLATTALLVGLGTTLWMA